MEQITHLAARTARIDRFAYELHVARKPPPVDYILRRLEEIRSAHREAGKKPSSVLTAQRIRDVYDEYERGLVAKERVADFKLFRTFGLLKRYAERASMLRTDLVKNRILRSSSFRSRQTANLFLKHVWNAEWRVVHL